MLPFSSDARGLQRAHTIRTPPGGDAALSAFVSLVTVTFNLDIQTHPSEGPMTS